VDDVADGGARGRTPSGSTLPLLFDVVKAVVQKIGTIPRVVEPIDGFFPFLADGTCDFGHPRSGALYRCHRSLDVHGLPHRKERRGDGENSEDGKEANA
jgi:hypothetical protein